MIGGVWWWGLVALWMRREVLRSNVVIVCCHILIVMYVDCRLCVWAYVCVKVYEEDVYKGTVE